MIKKYNVRAICLISFLVLFYGLNNYFIVKHYFSGPLQPDEGFHLTVFLKYQGIFKNLFSNIGSSLSFKDVLYPPLFYVVAAVSSLFRDPSKVNAIMANIFFLFVMLISTYFLVRKISKSEFTSLCAVFVLSVFPMIFGMSRLFMVDFALTSMVVLVMCCFVYTDNLTNKNISILFGLSLWLAVITKWTAILFIIAPFLYVLFKLPNTNRKPQIKAIILVLLLCFALAGIWYGYSLYRLHYNNVVSPILILRGCMRMYEADFKWNSLPGLLYYARTLFPYQVSPIFSIIFFLSLYFFLKSKIKFKGLFFGWIVIPYIVLTIIGNKSARHIMPILPAIAAIIAIGINQITIKRIRYFLIYFMFTIGIAQYFIVSYIERGALFKFSPVVKELFCGNIDEDVDYIDPNYLGYCDKENNKHLDIINQIIGTLDTQKQQARILNRAPNIGIIWPGKISPFAYDFNLKNSNVALYGFYELPKVFLKEANSFDFIIMETRNGFWPTKDEIINRYKAHKLSVSKDFTDNDYVRFEHFFEDLSRKFSPVGLFKFSNNAYIYVLARNEYVSESNLIKYINTKSVLENDGLKLGFDDGLVTIYYLDKELTQGYGLYDSFSVNGIYYSSSDAIWNIEKTSASSLTAIAYWPGLALKQIWNISLINGQLNWKIELDNPEEITLKNLNARIFLKDTYNDWVNLYTKGSLSKISFIPGNLSSELSRSSFIGLEPPLKGEPLPAITLDSGGNYLLNAVSLERFKDPFTKITSSAFFIDARKESLLFSKGNSRLFSGELRIFDKKQDFSQYVSQAQSAQYIKEGSLKLLFNQGRAHLYYLDKELTQGYGLYDSFSVNGIYYSSSDAIWNIEKTSASSLTAIAYWPGLALKQIWNISLINGQLNWKIELDNPEEITLKNLNARIFLKDTYNDWVNLYTKGSLSKISFIPGNLSSELSRSSFIGLEPPLKGEPLPAITLDSGGNYLLNAVSLERFKDPFTKITSSAFFIDARKESLLFSKGNSRLFSGELRIFDKKQDFSQYVSQAQSVQYIKEGSLKLLFNQGRAHIYYLDKELTQNEAIHILFLSSGKWYTSAEAIWTVEKPLENKLIAKGKLLELPISCILEFLIRNDGVIEIKADLEIYENIDLGQESFVMMVSDNYKSYNVPLENKKGLFPENHVSGYAWDDMWRGKTSTAFQIEAVNNTNGDKIVLGSSALSGNYYLTISNTNVRHKARALICAKHRASQAEALASGHNLFTGYIKISRGVN